MYNKAQEANNVTEEGFQTVERKASKTGKLMKNRFKNMQKGYNPVNAKMIGGILSDQNKIPNKQNINVDPKHHETDEINCWSRA